MEIMIMIGILFGVMLIVGVLALCNEKLPRWFCDKLQWHLPPKSRDHNGQRLYGKCPRCQKIIFLTESGIWKSKNKLNIR